MEIVQIAAPGYWPSNCHCKRAGFARTSIREGQRMLYVGPDQIIPLSGFLGTAAGLALIFWGKLTQGVRKLATALARSRNSQ